MNRNIIYSGQLEQGTNRFIVPGESPAAVKNNPLNDYIANKQQKNSHSNLIGAGVGAITGALIGGMVTNSQMKKRYEAERLQRNTVPKQQKPSVDGNYYTQVQNIISNLKVVFTPNGVIFTVKNSKSPFTLDNITISEMNEDMIKSWESKNEEYFKNILINKMLTDIQIAERSFARRLLQKHAEVNEALTGETIELDIYKNASVTLIDDCYKIMNVLCENEKIASAYTKSLDDDTVYEIVPALDRPFDKYAGVFSGVRSSLGFGEGEDNFNKNLDKLSNPKFLVKNLNVGFFPDRVVFSCNNQLLSTLEVLDMNKDGYEKFQKMDKLYFKDLFVNEMKRNKNKINKSIEKMAEVVEENNTLEDILSNSKINPLKLYNFMNLNFEKDWIDFDFEVIGDILKKKFEIEDVPEAVLNKIYSLCIVLKPNSKFFDNAYVFEKVVASFVSKPVEFFEINQEGIAFEDIIFTIDCVDRIIDTDDIYDNFGEEILTYISEVFSKNEIISYPLLSDEVTGIQLEFQKIINEKILEELLEKTTLDKITISYVDILCKQVTPLCKKHELGMQDIENIMRKFGVHEKYEKIVRRQLTIIVSVIRYMKIKNSEIE